MKAIIQNVVIALLLISIGFFHNEIYEFVKPVKDYSHLSSDKVILYSTTWCGYCKKTKELFARNKVPYLEYDVEHSEKGKSEFDALGKSTVPVILIGDTLIHGFNVHKIYKALDAL